MSHNSKEYWVKYLLDKDTSKVVTLHDNIENYIKDWFSSLPSSDSLRLSDKGKYYFDLILGEYYDFTATRKTRSYTKALYYVFLGKKLHVPFHVEIDKETVIIRLYDKKTALLIMLYGGIEDYLGK